MHKKQFLAVAVLLAGFLASPSAISRAQSLSSRDILFAFIARIDAEDVRWEDDQALPGSSVYFRKKGGTADYTNAAQLVDTADAYGTTGGDVWVQQQLDKVTEGCSSGRFDFHQLNAYSIHCEYEGFASEIILFGKGPWGAAVYDFLAPNSEYQASYLAEELYQVLSEMVAPAAGDTTSVATLEATMPAIGEIDGDALTRLAVGVLSEYGRQVGGQTPGLFYLRPDAPDHDPNKFIVICDQQALEGYAMYCSDYSFLSDDETKQLAESGGALYSLWYIVERSSDPVVYNYFFGMLVYSPSEQFLQQLFDDQTILPEYRLSTEDFSFHGYPARRTTWNGNNIWVGQGSYQCDQFWIHAPWLFYVARLRNSSDVALDQEPEILYQLTDQAGMYAAPTAPSSTGAENPLGVLGGLLVASLLPAFLITGFASLVDLALTAFPSTSTIPAGMVNSPIPGYGPVSPEAANYQQDLLRRGYLFDPKSRTFRAPQIKSPVDGSLVSFQQAEREKALLAQGLIYDPTTDGFYPPEYFTNREKNWQAFNDRLDERRDKEVMEQAIKKEMIREQREYVGQLEQQAEADRKYSDRLDMDQIASLWAAAQLSSREIVTGVDADGNISWKGMALRAVAGAASGGLSEYGYNAADFSYRVHDSMEGGSSLSEAVVTSAGWMGAEYLGFHYGGKLVKWAAGSKPIMWLGGQVRSGMNSLKESLLPESTLLKAVREAVGSGKPSEIIPDKVRALYQKQGMSALRELEAQGLLTPEQARALNKTITNDVHDAVEKATPKAMRDFEKQTGVKVQEAIIGDSGSSARGGGPRSVKTDADRTVQAVFDEQGLDKRAQEIMAKNKNVSLAEARQEAQNQLQSEFSALHQDSVSNQLSDRSLTAKDVDYNNYSGHAGDPRKKDSYPAGFNRTRMAAQGEARVFKPDASGEIGPSTRISGQSMVDRDALQQMNVRNIQPGSKEAAALIEKTQPRITPQDARKMLAEQQSAMSRASDPVKASKAVVRAQKARQILSGGTNPAAPDLPAISNKLLAQARALLSNPQAGNQGLGASFLNSAKDQIAKMMKVL